MFANNRSMSRGAARSRSVDRIRPRRAIIAGPWSKHPIDECPPTALRSLVPRTAPSRSAPPLPFEESLQSVFRPPQDEIHTAVSPLHSTLAPLPFLTTVRRAARRNRFATQMPPDPIATDLAD